MKPENSVHCVCRGSQPPDLEKRMQVLLSASLFVVSSASERKLGTGQQVVSLISLLRRWEEARQGFVENKLDPLC